MRERRQKHRHRRIIEPQGQDRWMISYADFITLLFVFFVVMYSVSSANEGKYRVLSESIIAAFSHSEQQASNKNQEINSEHITDETQIDDTSVIGDTQSSGEQSVEPKKTDEDVVIKRMADSVEKAMAPWIDKELIYISKSPIWLQIEINASALFTSGSSTVSIQARPILKGIADILQPFPNAVHVEGFTDSVPINTAEFPSNWELSSARSASIVRMFQEAGIDPRRMAAVGYSEFKPVADNSTEHGRNRNRRIIIVILSGNDPRNFIDIVEN